MEWSELEARCAACQGCALWQTRTNLVFGTGSRTASLMFVGEAPGEQEDKTGIPFVGAAGQLLDKYLEAVGIARDEVYIANILKCRPPRNRDPLPEEQDACIGHLREQVKLIRPKMIVCLGRISAMRLIHPDYRITKEHGQWYEDARGRKVMALFHPAALLRDPRKLPDTFEDLKRLEAEIAASCPKTWAVMQNKKETEC